MLDERRLHLALLRGRCRRGSASCPAGPSAACTGSRPARRARTARATPAIAAVDGAVVHARRAVLARELRGVLAGALAEHDQVRQRVAAEAVGAVDARGALAGGEEAGNRRHLRVGIHANPAHDVVRGRADFHRLLRDVEVGELLELVVHARQLAPDVRLGVGELFLDPGDVEEDAAVRRSAAGLHLAVDAARHVVAREQLGRTPGATCRPACSASLPPGRTRSAACSCRGCRRT